MTFRQLFLFVFLTVLPGVALAGRVSLFDGKSFEGWEGDTTKTWVIEDGALVGGSLEGNPRNEFLTTTKSFRNFDLKLEYKLVGTEGFVNGGVQFRSQRISEPPNEMSGYQADIGAGYSGCLYDESRRKKMLVKADKELIERIEKPGDWNQYEVRCEAGRIRIYLNGQLTVDYTEREADIAQDGVFGLQIHGKCKARIAYRNITVERYPDDLVPEEAEILNRFGDKLGDKVALNGWTDGKLKIGQEEVVIFVGQTNLVREERSGELESRLSAGLVAQRPHFRSMAWEGDTVYEQWRDLNFGSWRGQLDAVGATVVVAQFGQMEAFDGLARLPEFAAAYHKLLDQFSARTPRLVLLSPTPFEKSPLQHGPDLTARNAIVKAYSKAVAEVARQRGAIFIDLFTPFSARPTDAAPLTDNGIHLNAEGLKIVSALIAKEMGAKPNSETDLSGLQKLIAEKNRLWMDCWRPANWSFVYGDRITQRFGKAGGDFPTLHKTFEANKALIGELDNRIYALARGEKVLPLPERPLPSTPEADVLSPEAEMATFTLADGFEVELFASEINGVAKPTKMTWDERGRLWVACSPTYPQALPGIKPADYILVLEDTNGDGRIDKSTRFAEGLTMIQGIEPADGGLYVCDFDQLLFLRDTNGDGKADERKVVFSGFGIGDTHQLVNSITHGPDGTLWFSQGLHAFSRVETPWGPERLEKAGLWRFHPRTQRLDAFFNGGKAGHNCWGVAFDDYGQVFHKSGDRPDGYYSVPGMVRLRNPDEYHPIGSLFSSNPKTTVLDFIGTKGMPEALQGCVVIGGYFGNVVELHRLQDDGAGFKSEQLPKLLTSSSKAFRPVDVSVGPDGAIYVADWFNPVIGHYQASYADPQRDRSHGRIWRISAKGLGRVKQPDLAKMSFAQLLDTLRSPERWTRRQAKRLLFDGPEAEVLKAADLWVSGLDPKAGDYEKLLLEVSGVYESHETARPELLAKLLAARDWRVRAYGARVVGAWAGRLADPLAILRERIHDESPRTRLEALLACSYVGTADAAAVAVQVTDSPRDKFIDYAMAQVLRSLETEWKPALAAQTLRFANPAHAEILRTLAGKPPEKVHPGKLVYETLCLNCHQPDGKGLAGIYPPLAGSEWVTGDKNALIRIVLHGLSGPISVGGISYGVAAPVPMPPMGLDDQQAADVLSYVRETFGNGAPAVTPAEVGAVRAATSSRATFWTAAELADSLGK